MWTVGLLALCLMANWYVQGAAFSPTTTVALVSSIQHHYHCGCITLILSSLGLKAQHHLLQMLKILSNLMVPTPTIAPNPGDEVLPLCTRGKALNIVLDPMDILQISSKLLKSSAQWLFLLENVNSTESVLKSVNIPFDNEILVAKQLSGLEVALTEVFQIGQNQSLRVINWGNWHIQKGLRGRLETFHARSGGLHGATLRVAVAQYAPITTVKEVNGAIVDVGGYMGQVWHLMEHQMNCRTEFLGPSDGKWGFELENGSWNGIIGMVSREEVDLTINGYIMNKEQVKVVSYSPAVLSDRYFLMIQQPQMKSSGWNKFLTPFSLQLWLALLASIFVLGTVLAMLCRVIGHYNKIDHHYSLLRTLYYVYGIFCQQGHSVTPHSISGRLVYWITYLISLVIYTAYASKLISFLTIQKVTLPFTTYEGALENGKYRVGLVAKSSFYYNFQTTNNQLLHEVFVRLIESEDQLPTSPMEGLQQLCRNWNYAFFVSMNVASGLQKHLPCRIVHIPGSVISGPVAWLLPKTSPYRKFFAKSLLQLHRAGLLQALHARIWPVYEPFPMQENIHVSLEDISPLLALLAIGVAVAVSLLLGEFLGYHRKCNSLHYFSRCSRILISNGVKREGNINS